MPFPPQIRSAEKPHGRGGQWEVGGLRQCEARLAAYDQRLEVDLKASQALRSLTGTVGLEFGDQPVVQWDRTPARSWNRPRHSSRIVQSSAWPVPFSWIIRKQCI